MVSFSKDLSPIHQGLVDQVFSCSVHQLFVLFSAATFVNFLLQFESPHEVHDYVKLHIGDSPASKEFTRQFLERAKQCKQQQKPTATSGSPSSMPQVKQLSLLCF